MQNENLEKIIKDVELVKQNEAAHFREVIDYEKNSLPIEVNDETLQHQIDMEIQNRMDEFQKDMDLKPRALYYALKMETELHPDIDEKELKKIAYDFLEKNTKNKYLKKIIKELKKRR